MCCGYDVTEEECLQCLNVTESEHKTCGQEVTTYIHHVYDLCRKLSPYDIAISNCMLHKTPPHIQECIPNEICPELKCDCSSCGNQTLCSSFQCSPCGENILTPVTG